MKSHTLLCIFLVVLATGCMHPQEDAVVIGAVLPLQGMSTIYGQYNMEGMELAIEEVNAAGGINGQQLKIEYEDSQSEPRLAVSALQKLIGKDISLVLASAASSETLAQAPVAEQNQVVLLASGSAAPKVREAGEYVFRIKVSVDKELEGLMNFIQDDLQAETIHILYAQSDYGEGINKFANSIFLDLGGSVLGSDGFDIDDTDFSTALLKVQHNNPDVVVLGGWPRHLGLILKQAEELGIAAQFVAPGGAIGPEILEIAGESANGLLYTFEFDVTSEIKETQYFRENYNKKYGRDPELFAAMGYDAVLLIADAAKVCDTNSTCVRDHLYSVQGHQGASGVITFDEKGDILKPVKIFSVSNGKLHVPYS